MLINASRTLILATLSGLAFGLQGLEDRGFARWKLIKSPEGGVRVYGYVAFPKGPKGLSGPNTRMVFGP